ncbi:hypothetical protein V8G54_026183 [Vigna mungo]|uniref:Uncharacterized protein n=1 Tax=Vigna mungo TaxID=3915 RepID=A0AAQ3RLX7_VIGMU
MEFTDIGRKVGPERCMDLNSLPVVASQTVPFESGQNNVNGQLLPSSSKMITDKLPAELLHKNNDNFTSQVFSTPSSRNTNWKWKYDCSSFKVTHPVISKESCFSTAVIHCPESTQEDNANSVHKSINFNKDQIGSISPDYIPSNFSLGPPSPIYHAPSYSVCCSSIVPNNLD